MATWCCQVGCFQGLLLTRQAGLKQRIDRLQPVSSEPVPCKPVQTLVERFPGLQSAVRVNGDMFKSGLYVLILCVSSFSCAAARHPLHLAAVDRLPAAGPDSYARKLLQGAYTSSDPSCILHSSVAASQDLRNTLHDHLVQLSTPSNMNIGLLIIAATTRPVIRTTLGPHIQKVAVAAVFTLSILPTYMKLQPAKPA